MRQRVAASFMSVALLVASFATDGVLYRCLMEGLSRGSCCCHQDSRDEPAPLRLERAQDCCEVSTFEADTPLGTLVSERARLIGPLVATLPALGDAPARAAYGLMLPHQRAPPGSSGPPLFVQNCAFLI